LSILEINYGEIVEERRGEERRERRGKKEERKERVIYGDLNHRCHHMPQTQPPN
jgi:hypothetical protein